MYFLFKYNVEWIFESIFLLCYIVIKIVINWIKCMRNLFIIFYLVLCILIFCLILIFLILYGFYKYYYIYFIGKIVKYVYCENVNF